MKLRSSDLQSDSDLDSIRNSCGVLFSIQVLETPANSRFPMHPLQVTSGRKWISQVSTDDYQSHHLGHRARPINKYTLQTPMITPKFDTTQLSRTVSRVAKAGEVKSWILQHLDASLLKPD